MRSTRDRDRGRDRAAASLGKYYSASADSHADASAQPHANAESFTVSHANTDIVTGSFSIDDAVRIAFSDVCVSRSKPGRHCNRIANSLSAASPGRISRSGNSQADRKAVARRRRVVRGKRVDAGTGRMRLRHLIVASQSRCGRRANAESLFRQAWCQRIGRAPNHDGAAAVLTPLR